MGVGDIGVLCFFEEGVGVLFVFVTFVGDFGLVFG